jgi:3-methyladenine DNA glycosylase AlkD
MVDSKISGLVGELESELRAVGDDRRAAGAKAYLKSDLEFVGVAAKPLRAVARAFLDDHPDLERRALLELVRSLWRRPVFELKAVAVALLEKKASELEVDDLEVVEELIRTSHTWALVDWLSTKVAAPVVESDLPTARGTLARWSEHENFWVRRASMLSLLPALRSGGGEFELFAAFASRMVREEEFFIRKAIGWVLREVGKRRPDLTFDFLADHIDEVSALTLREGSKYLPAQRRADLRDRRRRGELAR